MKIKLKINVGYIIFFNDIFLFIMDAPKIWLNSEPGNDPIIKHANNIPAVSLEINKIKKYLNRKLLKDIDIDEIKLTFRISEKM